MQHIIHKCLQPILQRAPFVKATHKEDRHFSGPLQQSNSHPRTIVQRGLPHDNTSASGPPQEQLSPLQSYFQQKTNWQRYPLYRTICVKKLLLFQDPPFYKMAWQIAIQQQLLTTSKINKYIGMAKCYTGSRKYIAAAPSEDRSAKKQPSWESRNKLCSPQTASQCSNSPSSKSHNRQSQPLKVMSCKKKKSHPLPLQAQQKTMITPTDTHPQNMLLTVT